MKLIFRVPTSSSYSIVGVLASLLFAAAAISAHAQDPTFRIGPVAQKNAVLQPGIEVAFTDSSLFPRKLRFSFTYTTSRGAAALGGNGLVEDRFLVGSGWYFRPRRTINPYAQIEAGFTRYNREDEELFALLDNDALIASAVLGIEIQLLDRRISLQSDAGYSIIHSSTVYPFVASMGLFYSL